MTAEKLKQYRALLREVAMLDREIKTLQDKGPDISSDSVSSSAEFPYSLHTVRISGLDWSGYNRSLYKVLRQRETARARAEAELDEIERYIAGIDDSLVRQIVRYRYIDGLTWSQVAQRVGGGNTEGGVKMILARYLRAR